MARPINKDDRDQWYHSPVTQAFLQTLREKRQENLEDWAKEVFTGETPELTLQANAKALGGIAVLDQTIELIEGARAPLEAPPNDEQEEEENE